MTVVKDKKEKKELQKVIAYDPPILWVKETIEAAGTTLGSVWFNKRSDNTLRKMSYHLHVKNPSTAKQPKGLSRKDNSLMSSSSVPSTSTISSDGILTYQWDKRKEIEKAHKMITVLDANKVVKDEEGNILGRGAYRSVPLDRVVRIVNK
jgi:hypothetical protein